MSAAAAKSLQSCLTVQPHRRHPTGSPGPWDYPGKNTGVDCHFLLQCIKVKSLSCVQLFATPWITARQASLSIINSRSSPRLTSIESVMPSSHLIFCHPLLLLPIPPSIRVFSNESTLHIRWLKYWSFSFNISPCNEHPGLISFRMDWLDLLVVQGTLKSLLQHHNSKASILWHWAFFTVQLSHPYMTMGKTIALTRGTFVGKVMSLLLNMLSSTLAWKIPWTEEPGGLQSMGSLRVGHDWATSLSLFTSCIGEGNGNPLQCYCLENPRDGVAWWAAVRGVAQSRTPLKRLSSSSS